MSCKCAPALRKFLDDATLRWPSRSRLSDGCCGDEAHAARKSDHNPDSSGYAHAADITHDPANGADCHAIAAALTASNDSRIKYIIFDRRIWYPTAGLRPKGWSNYTGRNPHTSHRHLSIHAGMHFDTRPWPHSPVFDRKKITTQLQQLCVEAGVLPAGEVDGIPGPKTRAGTLALLKALGLNYSLKALGLN